MNDASFFSRQYRLVKYSRDTLLDYCNTITGDDFTKTNPRFGHASIRDILVHIANTYQAWLSRALATEFRAISPEDFPHLENIRNLFSIVDEQMNTFIIQVGNKSPEYFDINRNGKRLHLTPLQIFSHVTSHEFHHKGQVLSLSRQSGYIPVDTDMLR